MMRGKTRPQHNAAMLPTELQQTTLYSAGVTTSAREADAAMALIKAMTAPSTAAVYKARGLEPAW